MLRRIAWLVVPIGLVVLLAFAALGARAPGATTAFTLRVGDCFDIPADDRVGDVALLDCGQPHDAQAFTVGSLAAPSPAGALDYPGDPAIAAWVGANCGPAAQAAYLGPGGAPSGPDLVVGYFFPSADAWARGERQITCYLHADGMKLSAPLGNPEASAGPG